MKLLAIAILTLSAASPSPAQLAKALELNVQGNDASDAGRLDEAIDFYRQALVIWRESGPAYEAHQAGTLLNLGIVVSAGGNRSEAARLMEESLTLHRRTLGLRSHRTISNITLLASNLLMIGRVERAEELLREVLPVTRELFPKDIQTARTLEGICNVLVRQGRAAEALAPAEEALAIAIQATSEESLDTALAYSNVAEAHRSSGHPERALPLFHKARALYEKGLGPDHPRVAALLSQEGLIMLEDHKSATAEQLMTRAVAALENSCPKCTVEMAIAQNNLAVLRFRQKRYREADQLLTHVLSLREAYTAAPGPELAGTLKLLAVVREKENLHEDAARLTQRANVILGYR